MARWNGLLKIFGGALLTAVMFGLAYVIGEVVGLGFGGPIVVTLIILWPVMIIFAGWLQLLTGLPFSELSEYYNTSRPLKKFGLSIVFVVSSVAFLIGAIKIGVYFTG